MILSPDGRIDNAGTATIVEAVANGYEDGTFAGIFDALSNQLDAAIKLYPNPATEKATIAIDLKEAKDVSIELYDLNGNLLKAATYANWLGLSTVEMNTNQLNAGVYLVKVTIDGEISTKRLVVQ
jgi:hypothetical protein